MIFTWVFSLGLGKYDFQLGKKTVLFAFGNGTLYWYHLLIKKKNCHTTRFEFSSLHQVNKTSNALMQKWHEDIVNNNITFLHDNVHVDIQTGNGTICWHIKWYRKSKIANIKLKVKKHTTRSKCYVIAENLHCQQNCSGLQYQLCYNKYCITHKLRSRKLRGKLFS